METEETYSVLCQFHGDNLVVMAVQRCFISKQFADSDMGIIKEFGLKSSGTYKKAKKNLTVLYQNPEAIFEVTKILKDVITKFQLQSLRSLE